MSCVQVCIYLYNPRSNKQRGEVATLNNGGGGGGGGGGGRVELVSPFCPSYENISPG
jgi:hypothetical protein